MLFSISVSTIFFDFKCFMLFKKNYFLNQFLSVSEQIESVRNV